MWTSETQIARLIETAYCGLTAEPESNADRYLKVRNILLTQSGSKDRIVPQIRANIESAFLTSTSYESVVTDEDAVIVSSNPWFKISKSGNETYEVIKHALPYIKRDDLIDQKHLAVRRIKFHSFTGYPSFKEYERDDTERYVIGRCSCGLPRVVENIPMPPDPLHNAFDSKGHYEKLQSEVHLKMNEKQAFEKEHERIFDILRNGVPHSPIAINYHIINRSLLIQMHELAKNTFTNFRVYEQSLKYDDCLVKIESICQERINAILNDCCKIEWQKIFITWIQLHSVEHETDDKDWRNAEGAILAQASTYGAYIRLYYLMLCACKIDMTRIKEKEDQIRSKGRVDQSRSSEFAGMMRPSSHKSLSLEVSLAQKARDKEMHQTNQGETSGQADNNDTGTLNKRKVNRKKKNKNKANHQTSSVNATEEEHLMTDHTTEEEYLVDIDKSGFKRLVENFMNRAQIIENRLLISKVMQRIVFLMDENEDFVEYEDMFKVTVHIIGKLDIPSIGANDVNGNLLEFIKNIFIVMKHGLEHSNPKHTGFGLTEDTMRTFANIISFIAYSATQSKFSAFNLVARDMLSALAAKDVIDDLHLEVRSSIWNVIWTDMKYKDTCKAYPWHTFLLELLVNDFVDYTKKAMVNESTMPSWWIENSNHANKCPITLLNIIMSLHEQHQNSAIEQMSNVQDVSVINYLLHLALDRLKSSIHFLNHLKPAHLSSRTDKTNKLASQCSVLLKVLGKKWKNETKQIEESSLDLLVNIIGMLSTFDLSDRATFQTRFSSLGTDKYNMFYGIIESVMNIEREFVLEANKFYFSQGQTYVTLLQRTNYIQSLTRCLTRKNIDSTIWILDSFKIYIDSKYDMDIDLEFQGQKSTFRQILKGVLKNRMIRALKPVHEDDTLTPDSKTYIMEMLKKTKTEETYS